MAGKIKVIIKKPGEPYGHVTHISPSLENLQKHVGGYIEVLKGGLFVIICNEEGKVRGLSENFQIVRNIEGAAVVDVIRGTVIVAGQSEEDFADISFDFAAWKSLLKAWGN